MKTTFTSTMAMQNAVRLAVQRAQQELTQTQSEITTGRHADIGLALGSKTSRTISLTRDVARLDSILDNNALVAQRLSVSQDALGQLSSNGQTMMETLITVSSSSDKAQRGVAQREMTAMLENFVAISNTSSSGEFLFAGVNTDVKPMANYEVAAKAAFDAELDLAFGAGTPAGDYTAADMDTFLTNLEARFDADWGTLWSEASDTNMTSRITNSEIIESSTNANAEGFRKFALTAVIGAELLDEDLSGEARTVLMERLVGLAGEAIAGIDAERAELGVAESRVAKANTALTDQKDVVATYIGELEGVDPYEASTRMNTLLTQMEASYALTARIQQLSLMNYL
ncbi:flagellar hook-associated family protein [Pararhizobium haloflavum]|uniref:flagellar hook-associated family protein n=1 Tax=Pararhizobium haloflavum TaxID=2037914 RepID=UPI000C191192|nr:flagellar hook-associated family protein [Pararhizobium haloflavum]